MLGDCVDSMALHYLGSSNRKFNEAGPEADRKMPPLFHYNRSRVLLTTSCVVCTLCCCVVILCLFVL